MRTIHVVLAFTLSFGGVLDMAAAQTQSGEPHVAGQAALDALLADHHARNGADRAEVLKALERSEVQRLAAKMRVPLDTARARVATLDGAELRELAAQARSTNAALEGGASTVTISTTAIIIGLLVLILIIVAVD